MLFLSGVSATAYYASNPGVGAGSGDGFSAAVICLPLALPEATTGGILSNYDTVSDRGWRISYATDVEDKLSFMLELGTDAGPQAAASVPLSGASNKAMLLMLNVGAGLDAPVTLFMNGDKVLETTLGPGASYQAAAGERLELGAITGFGSPNNLLFAGAAFLNITLTDSEIGDNALAVQQTQRLLLGSTFGATGVSFWDSAWDGFSLLSSGIGEQNLVKPLSGTPWEPVPNSGSQLLFKQGPDPLQLRDLPHVDWGQVASCPAPNGDLVVSVFGRTGAVVAMVGDYDSDQVTNSSTVPGVSASDALDSLQTELGSIDTDEVANISGVAGTTTTNALDNLLALISALTTTDISNASGVAGATATDALNNLLGALSALTTTDIANASGVAGATATVALNNLLATLGALDSDDIANVSGVAGALVTNALDNLLSAIAALTSSDIANASGVAGADVTDALNSLAATIAALTSSDIANASTVPGVTVTDALNTLKAPTVQEVSLGASASISSSTYATLISDMITLVAGQQLLIDVSASFEQSGALSQADAYFQVLINATPWRSVAQQASDTQRGAVSITGRVLVGASGLIAGLNTIALRWRRVGGGTVSIDPSLDGQHAAQRLIQLFTP